jgi:hypothetical protein
MTAVFFSYTHVDEPLRKALDGHLGLLRRQGLIQTWYDRNILAGSELDAEIGKNLEAADIILLLVSSDFINSDYCFSKEMTRAMERHHAGEARVIPIILRPCDWHTAPFAKLKAIPNDGKAVTSWENIDEAFTDVAREIRLAVTKTASKAPSRPVPESSPKKAKSGTMAEMLEQSWSQARGPAAPAAKLKMKREFTDFDRDEFVQKAFEYVAGYFEHSLADLGRHNDGVQARFQRVDARKLTGIVYRNGKSEAECTVRVDKWGSRNSSIAFVSNASAGDNSSNEILFVENDSQSLYFKTLGMQSHGRETTKLDENGAAEYLWELLLRPLQY